jgi:hypothetical protein
VRTHDWDVGEIIHGFAGGAFGRDSYSCRRVEAVGHDWVVTRNTSGVVECVAGDRIPVRQEGNDLTYCTLDGDDICEYAPARPTAPQAPWS